MKKGIFREFDGYQDVVKEIEMSRKHGVYYTSDIHSPDQYTDRLHPKRLRLRVAEIREETSSTKTLRLVSIDNYLPPFLAGQYIALIFEINGIRTCRPYSISSAPNQIGYYDITVRRVAGGLISNHLLDEVKKGDLLESSGPSGNFYHNPLFHDDTMVCVAGGSGITPFMSMIREVVECGLDRNLYLFYGNKTLEEAVFHEALADLSNRFENIHYFPVIENAPPDYKGYRGLITGELVEEAVNDISGKTFYLCGPQGLYDFCIPELEKIGVPRRKLRKEVYGAPLNISEHPGWPEETKPEDVFTVRLLGGGALKARAGEPLILAFEREGLQVSSLCRSGECSMCRVKIISGKVFQPAGIPVRKSDRKYGYVHSCVSYPLEDLEVLI